MKFIFKYDNKNNQIESLSYDSKGNLESKTIKKYNTNNRIESLSYEYKGNLDSNRVFTNTIQRII